MRPISDRPQPDLALFYFGITEGQFFVGLRHAAIPCRTCRELYAISRFAQPFYPGSPGGFPSGFPRLVWAGFNVNTIFDRETDIAPVATE